MKNIFIVCCLAVASAAFGMELPVPPASVEVDAEASTNVVLGASIRDLSEIRVAVGLESSPTNAITVAIGRDADGDGELSASEEVMSFGCDCGTWFVRDADGIVEELATAAFGWTERELTIPLRGTAADWNLVRVTRHGFGSFGGRVAVDWTRRYLFIRIR